MGYRVKIVLLSLYFQSNPFLLVSSLIFTSRQVSLKHTYTGMLEDCAVCSILDSGDHRSSGTCSDEQTGRIYQLGNHGLMLLPRPLSEPSVFPCYLDPAVLIWDTSQQGVHYTGQIFSIHISSCFLYLPPLSCFIASIKRFHNHTLLPQFVFHIPLFSTMLALFLGASQC